MRPRAAWCGLGGRLILLPLACALPLGATAHALVTCDPLAAERDPACATVSPRPDEPPPLQDWLPLALPPREPARPQQEAEEPAADEQDGPSEAGEEEETGR